MELWLILLIAGILSAIFVHGGLGLVLVILSVIFLIADRRR